MLHKLKRLALIKEPKYAAHTYRSFDAAAAIYCRIERSCSLNGCQIAELVENGVLEIGTGRIATAPHVFIALGAKKVATFDVERQFDSQQTDLALQNSKIAHRLLEGLSYGISHEDVVQNINSFSSGNLLDTGKIAYSAPTSNEEAQSLGKFSFQYSYTVLEHVEAHILPSFFKSVKKTLTTNGVSVHYVDHINHAGGVRNPFEHLTRAAKMPKASENSCAVNLSTIVEVALAQGLKLKFSDVHSFDKKWHSMIETDQIREEFRNNNGITTAILGFEHA